MKIRSFFDRKKKAPAGTEPVRPPLPQGLPRGFTALQISTPAFGGMLHHGYVRSIVRTNSALIALGINHEYRSLVNESMISRGRDNMAANFMASGCSHLLMIDADIEWPAEAVPRLLVQAATHDFVMGIYRRKREEVDYPVVWTVATGNPVNVHPETGCVEIESGPGGFVMLSRRVFERMAEAWPEMKYETGRECDEHLYSFFNPFQRGHHLFGEDVSFCLRWRSLGESVWVDPKINLIHHGVRAYEGNPLAHLFRQAPVATDSAA